MFEILFFLDANEALAYRLGLWEAASMIESLTFPKSLLPEDFTADNVKNLFSEDEKIAFNFKKSAINGYLRDEAHLSLDRWIFDTKGCSEKVRKKLVHDFREEAFTVALDAEQSTLTLSLPKKELDGHAELRKKIESAAMKRFSALCREIPEKVQQNCRADIWRCIIYDTSEKIVDEIEKQILSGNRGFRVEKGLPVLEPVGDGFYRTAQVLTLSVAGRKADQIWNDVKATLEFDHPIRN